MSIGTHVRGGRWRGWGVERSFLPLVKSVNISRYAARAIGDPCYVPSTKVVSCPFALHPDVW